MTEPKVELSSEQQPQSAKSRAGTQTHNSCEGKVRRAPLRRALLLQMWMAICFFSQLPYHFIRSLLSAYFFLFFSCFLV